MSLQYIIDACNLINHPKFKPVSKSALNLPQALADFIRFNKLVGSKNNTVLLVFDGYPPNVGDIPREAGLTCQFSRNKEADELIKADIQASPAPRNIIVVSDDKEVQLSSRFLRAQACSVSDFIGDKRGSRRGTASQPDALDFELSHIQIQKINAELKKKWL